MPKLLMLSEEIERIESLLEKKHAHIESFVSAKNQKQAAAMTISNNDAVISVRGMLVPTRDPWLDFLDEEQTAYADIVSQVSEANRANRDRIILDINSPGGYVDGLHSAISAINGSSVPVLARVDGTAASAAYMLASQAKGGIFAADDLTQIGSVGVAVSARKPVFSVDIANTDSPKKRPNVATDEGIAMVREGLDDVFEILAEKIADGRGTTIEAVKRDFGMGGVYSARTALKNKMIDGIGKIPEKNQTQTGMFPAANEGHKKMTLEQLKAEHGELYAAVLEAGMKAERERVEAHLTLASASGDIETAHAAIKSGEGLTDAVKAKHFAAEIRKNSVAARQAEAPAAVNPEPEKVSNEKTEEQKARDGMTERLAAKGVNVVW